MTLLIRIFFTLVVVRADICNHLATLIKKDQFYITQPYDAEVELDLQNYLNFFKDIEVYSRPFGTNLQNYTTEAKLKEHEPWVIHPYDDEKNVVLLPDDYTTTSNAPSVCAERGNELIYFNKGSQAKMVEVLKKLNVKQAPFTAFPSGKSIFGPSLGFIDTPENQLLTAIPEHGYPQLRRNGVILYPLAPVAGSGPTTTTTTTTTTEGPGSLNSTRAGLDNKILCFRKNNPWDLASKRESWLGKATRLAQSLKIFDQLTPAFNSMKKFFKHLEKVKTNTSKRVKLTLPTFMGKVVSFIKEFSNAARWEETVSRDEDRFDDFADNLQTLESTIHLTEPNLLNMQKSKKLFIPMFNKGNWEEKLLMDEQHYGLTSPLEVQILGIPTEDTPAADVNTVVAKVTARTFNKNDLITLYAVEPNIVKGEMAAVKYVVSTPHTKFALIGEPSLAGCSSQENELYKKCKSIATPEVNIRHDEQSMIDCAKALMDTGLSSNFNKCPLISAPDFPIAYRAYCDNGNQTVATAIVNSKTPLKLSFVCDGRETSIKDVDRFPLQIATTCAIQELKGEAQRTILPQMQKENLQSGSMGILSTPPPVTTTKTDDTLQKYLVPVGLFTLTLIIVVIFLITLVAIFEPSRLCCARQRNTTMIAETSVAPEKADFESSRISKSASKRSLNTITLLC